MRLTSSCIKIYIGETDNAIIGDMENKSNEERRKGGGEGEVRERPIRAIAAGKRTSHVCCFTRPTVNHRSH